MGTVVFPCGCSITTSVFDGGPFVLDVSVCTAHAEDGEMQMALSWLADIIHEQQEEETP